MSKPRAKRKTTATQRRSPGGGARALSEQVEAIAERIKWQFTDESEQLRRVAVQIAMRGAKTFGYNTDGSPDADFPLIAKIVRLEKQGLGYGTIRNLLITEDNRDISVGGIRKILVREGVVVGKTWPPKT